MPATIGHGRLKRAASSSASSCVLSPISPSATTPVDHQNASTRRATSCASPSAITAPTTISAPANCSGLTTWPSISQASNNAATGSTLRIGELLTAPSLGSSVNTAVNAVPYSTVSATSPPQPAAASGQRQPSVPNAASAPSTPTMPIVNALRTRPSRSATSCCVSASTRPKLTPAPSANADARPAGRPLRTRVGRTDELHHVQCQRQPDQDHRHRDQGRALGPAAVDHARRQRGPDRVAVEHQQRQPHRQARHRGIQAHALHADQQADHQHEALVARRGAPLHALAPAPAATPRSP